MNCIKCGYCCVHYDVIVPVDPNLGMKVGNLTHKVGHVKCHLANDDGTCSVHDREWYRETACFHYDYGEGKNCRFTPGKKMAETLMASIGVHVPNSNEIFRQDVLGMLSEEMVQNNISKRNALSD